MSTRNAVCTTRTISTICPVLLIDIPIDEEFKVALGDCKPHAGDCPLIVDCADLSSALDQHISGMQLPQETIFVFPGNGGLDVENRLVLLNGYPKARVFAKRIWHQGSDPVVIVNEIPSETFIDSRTKTIFILDDVVGSGQTAHKLRSRNEWKFPRAVWYLGSWIDRGIKLKGFSHVFSSMTIRHTETPEKKVPINSLSTLVKKAEMCAIYAEKNFPDHRKFVRVVEEIRSSIST